MTAIPSPHPLPFNPSLPPPPPPPSFTTSTPTSTTSSPSHSHHPSITNPPSLPDIFQDLESRFLLNLPDSELSSFPRLFFQVQQAHWFYCDFYYDRWPHHLPPYNNLKQFCSKFFSLSPLLSSQLSRFEGLYESFTSYLQSVPVCGVILLNGRLDRVVMVRGWKGNSWSFPKGKIDANESELACAVRECREEVGYEVGEGEVGEWDWIEAAVNGKSVKLFVVSGVDESYNFETRTRKEISGIEWVDITALPSYRDNNRAEGGGGGGGEEKRRKFWNVLPFADELRRWIANKRKGKSTQQQQRRNKPPTQQQQAKHIRPPSSPPIPIQHANALSVAPSSSPLSSSVPTASASHPTTTARPAGVRQSIDDSNALTFAGGGGSGGGGGRGGGGWSAEEMFALNEAKYGVRSSVVEEKLEEPDNIDEIMRSVMGPKYRGGGGRGGNRGDRERGGGKHRSARSEQLSNHTFTQSPFNSQPPLPPLSEQSAHGTQPQQPQRGRGFRGRGRGNTRNTLPLPTTSANTATTAATTTSASPLNVDELDFSHNPYQARTTLAVSTTNTTHNPTTSPATHLAATHSSPSSVLPSPASFTQMTTKSAATPTTQPQTTGSSRAVPPQTARASDRSSATSSSTFSEFRFDLDSILQPLSDTRLD